MEIAKRPLTQHALGFRVFHVDLVVTWDYLDGSVSRKDLDREDSWCEEDLALKLVQGPVTTTCGNRNKERTSPVGEPAAATSGPGDSIIRMEAPVR